MTIHLRLACAISLLAACAASVRAGNWPGWRGPTGMGTTSEKDLPLRWNARGEGVRWKAALPGTTDRARPDENQSSPIVWGDKVFVTVSYWPEKGDRKGFPEHHVACYRADDGKLLWDRTVAPGPWQLSDLRGGYTAPTPACDGERVYVLFGSAVLAALDFDGKELWRLPIEPHDFDVAIGTSPVLHGETVLLQCDQVNRSSRLMALDRKTGDIKWARKRPEDGFSHSTPVLVDVGGKTQLLVAAAGRLEGTDPDDGSLLWWCQAHGDTCSPIYGDGLVYVDSGRGGGPGVAVEPSGAGDVTRTLRKWKIDRVPEGFSSAVTADGLLYRLVNPGLLRCWRMKDGEELYSERLAGASTAASPIVTSDGRLYAASAGRSYVVHMGRKLEVIGGGDLGDPSPASPAVASGRIYIKGRQYLWCIGGK